MTSVRGVFVGKELSGDSVFVSINHIEMHVSIGGVTSAYERWRYGDLVCINLCHDNGYIGGFTVPVERAEKLIKELTCLGVYRDDNPFELGATDDKGVCS